MNDVKDVKMLKVDVINLDMKKVDQVDLNPRVFALQPRVDIIQRVVVYQDYKRHYGTHKTKTISDVTGSGRKPFRQKGTGNARRGSNYDAQCRGGGIVFGPTGLKRKYSLPKKIRRLALKHALSQKLLESNLIILDEIKTDNISCKTMYGKLYKLLNQNLLLVDVEKDLNFWLSVRNIPRLSMLLYAGINVRSIINCDKLILSKDAVNLFNTKLSDDDE